MSTSDRLDFSLVEGERRIDGDPKASEKSLPPFKIIDLTRKKKRAGTSSNRHYTLDCERKLSNFKEEFRQLFQNQLSSNYGSFEKHYTHVISMLTKQKQRDAVKKFNLTSGFQQGKTAEARGDSAGQEDLATKGTFIFTDQDVLTTPMLHLAETKVSPEKRQVQNLQNLASSDTFIDDLLSDAVNNQLVHGNIQSQGAIQTYGGASGQVDLRTSNEFGQKQSAKGKPPMVKSTVNTNFSRVGHKLVNQAKRYHNSRAHKTTGTSPTNSKAMFRNSGLQHTQQFQMDGVNFQEDQNMQSIQQLTTNQKMVFRGTEEKFVHVDRPKTGSTQVTKQFARTGQMRTKGNISLQGDLEMQELQEEDIHNIKSAGQVGVLSQTSKQHQNEKVRTLQSAYQGKNKRQMIFDHQGTLNTSSANHNYPVPPRQPKARVYSSDGTRGGLRARTNRRNLQAFNGPTSKLNSMSQTKFMKFPNNNFGSKQSHFPGSKMGTRQNWIEISNQDGPESFQIEPAIHNLQTFDKEGSADGRGVVNIFPQPSGEMPFHQEPGIDIQAAEYQSGKSSAYSFAGANRYPRPSMQGRVMSTGIPQNNYTSYSRMSDANRTGNVSFASLKRINPYTGMAEYESRKASAGSLHFRYRPKEKIERQIKSGITAIDFYYDNLSPEDEVEHLRYSTEFRRLLNQIQTHWKAHKFPKCEQQYVTAVVKKLVKLTKFTQGQNGQNDVPANKRHILVQLQNYLRYLHDFSKAHVRLQNLFRQRQSILIQLQQISNSAKDVKNFEMQGPKTMHAIRKMTLDIISSLKKFRTMRSPEYLEMISIHFDMGPYYFEQFEDQGNELDLIRSGLVWKVEKQKAWRTLQKVVEIDNFMLRKLKVFFEDGFVLFLPKQQDRIIKDIEKLQRVDRTSFNVQEIGVFEKLVSSLKPPRGSLEEEQLHEAFTFIQEYSYDQTRVADILAKPIKPINLKDSQGRKINPKVFREVPSQKDPATGEMKFTPLTNFQWELPDILVTTIPRELEQDRSGKLKFVAESLKGQADAIEKLAEERHMMQAQKDALLIQGEDNLITEDDHILAEPDMNLASHSVQPGMQQHSSMIGETAPGEHLTMPEDQTIPEQEPVPPNKQTLQQTIDELDVEGPPTEKDSTPEEVKMLDSELTGSKNFSQPTKGQSGEKYSQNLQSLPGGSTMDDKGKDQQSADQTGQSMITQVKASTDQQTTSHYISTQKVQNDQIVHKESQMVASDHAEPSQINYQPRGDDQSQKLATTSQDISSMGGIRPVDNRTDLQPANDIIKKQDEPSVISQVTGTVKREDFSQHIRQDEMSVGLTSHFQTKHKPKEKSGQEDATGMMSSINYPEGDHYELKSFKSNIHPQDPSRKLEASKMKDDVSYDGQLVSAPHFGEKAVSEFYKNRNGPLKDSGEKEPAMPRGSREINQDGSKKFGIYNKAESQITYSKPAPAMNKVVHKEGRSLDIGQETLEQSELVFKKNANLHHAEPKFKVSFHESEGSSQFGSNQRTRIANHANQTLGTLESKSTAQAPAEPVILEQKSKQRQIEFADDYVEN